MATDEFSLPSAHRALEPVKLCMSAVVAGSILSLAMSRNFYDSSMTSAFLALAIASAFVILVVLRRSWSDLVLVLLSAAIIAFVDLYVRHFPYRFMAWFSFVGMGSFLVMALRTVWSEKQDRTLMLCAFLPTALFVASDYMASTLLDITEKLHPKVFDLYLYYFDCSLGVQISFVLGQLLRGAPWLRFACLAFYLALPLPLALVYAARLRQNVSAALPVMLAFLITGPVGILFYNVLPACGPVHLFGPGFPLHPPAIADVMRSPVVTVLIPHDARNAIPSLHMTWVLLVWWGSRKLSAWIRGVAFTFLAFTTLATMGIGEHYFVDIVVAYPFAVMIVALCSYTVSFSNAARRLAFLWGTFGTLLWFALLSFATPVFGISRAIPWVMVVVTIAISVIVQSRLQKELEVQPHSEMTATAEKVMAQHA